LLNIFLLNRTRTQFHISGAVFNENNECRNYHWYYNKCGESEQVYETNKPDEHFSPIDKGYYKGIQSSDPEVIYRQLIKYIDTYKELTLKNEADKTLEEEEVVKDPKEEADKILEEEEAVKNPKEEADKTLEEEEAIKNSKKEADKTLEIFKNLLKTKFIYSEKPFAPFENIHLNREQLNNVIETRFTRPNIEALFFDANSLFSCLIDRLVAMNDRSLFEALIASLANTKIPADKLFAWNQSIKDALLTQIADLEKYGHVLNTKKQEKGQYIFNLMAQLKEKIQAREVAPNESEISLEEKFKVLQFKLEATQLLHQQDAIASRHHGWKRVLVNMFTLLFTLTTANIGHKVRTGHWLFCSKTRTEGKMSTIQETMLKTKEGISFQNP